MGELYQLMREPNLIGAGILTILARVIESNDHLTLKNLLKEGQSIQNFF